MQLNRCQSKFARASVSHVGFLVQTRSHFSGCWDGKEDIPEIARIVNIRFFFPSWMICTHGKGIIRRLASSSFETALFHITAGQTTANHSLFSFSPLSIFSPSFSSPLRPSPFFHSKDILDWKLVEPPLTTRIISRVEVELFFLSALFFCRERSRFQ